MWVFFLSPNFIEKYHEHIDVKKKKKDNLTLQNSAKLFGLNFKKKY